MTGAKHFTCDCCGATYIKGQSDEEARAQTKADFGIDVRADDAAMTEKPLRPPPPDKPIGRVGTGRIVYTPALKPRHECDPPMVHKATWLIPQAAAATGTVWQCACGKMWVVRDEMWVRAGWWTRRKARKQAHNPRKAVT